MSARVQVKRGCRLSVVDRKVEPEREKSPMNADMVDSGLIDGANGSRAREDEEQDRKAKDREKKRHTKFSLKSPEFVLVSY